MSAMSDPPHATRERSFVDVDLPSPWLLLFALMGGPLAWAGALMANYTVSSQTCANGWRAPHLLMAGITIAACVICVASGLAAIVAWRAVPDVEGAAVSRARFMAHGGLMLSALGLPLTVFLIVPAVFLQMCATGHV